MTKPKILIIDDDPMLSELLTYNLDVGGYEVHAAAEGREGLRLYREVEPDLVLLDVMMPHMSGWEVCERLRNIGTTPIIMLTAKGQEEDIVRGLELGADDYLTKPFQVRVLLARIRAQLRRMEMLPQSDSGLDYEDDYMTVDLEKRRIVANGEPVKLTPTEFKFFALLVENKGRILEFRQILESVWGFEYIDELDYLRVYIWHLRKKLEPDPKNPVYLLSELNVGYRFEPQG